MGLIVDVLRNARNRDCTNGGISSQFDSICVVNCDGPSQPTDRSPAAILESHMPDCLRIVPAIQTSDGWAVASGWFMFGGNFAHGDSRLSKMAERLLGHTFYGAISIHDRQE